MAGELKKKLEGKISAFDIQNRYLEGKLFWVKQELYAFRDKNLVSFSEDNCALKEELEKLRPLKDELEKANNQVAEQKNKIERLPEAEKEILPAQTQAKEVEAQEEALKAQVKELKEAEARHEDQLAQVSVVGFQRALAIKTVMAPEANFQYFGGSYEARDGKLCQGDQLAYDPEVDDGSEAEEETGEPENAPKTAEASAEEEKAADGSKDAAA